MLTAAEIQSSQLNAFVHQRYTREKKRENTHVNGSLQTALHTGALKRGIHVAHGLAGLGPGLAHQRRHLARELELGLDRVGPLHGDHDAGVREPAVDGPAHAVGVDIRDDHVLGAEDLADGAAQEADGSRAQDEHRGARVEPRAVPRVQGDGQGLCEGAELEGDAVGQLVAVGGRVCDLLLEGALGVGEALCRGAEGHLPADVVAALLAQLALAAGQADLEGHVVAGPEVCHGRAHRRHGPRRLVAQGHGLPHLDVAVAVVAVVVQVRAAEAGRLDGHQDLGGLEVWEGALFLAWVLGGGVPLPLALSLPIGEEDYLAHYLPRGGPLLRGAPRPGLFVWPCWWCCGGYRPWEEGEGGVEGGLRLSLDTIYTKARSKKQDEFHDSKVGCVAWVNSHGERQRQIRQEMNSFKL